MKKVISLKLKLIALIVWALFIFFMSISKITYPEGQGGSSFGLNNHLMAYFVLAILLFFVLKEFNVKAFKFGFEPATITVNKGDRVRIKITVTSGAHDFKIDELNVFADTKEINKEYVIEFTVDKAGEFVYYCAKPKHRELGQWGTLKVLDN